MYAFRNSNTVTFNIVLSSVKALSPVTIEETYSFLVEGRIFSPQEIVNRIYNINLLKTH